MAAWRAVRSARQTVLEIEEDAPPNLGPDDITVNIFESSTACNDGRPHYAYAIAEFPISLPLNRIGAVIKRAQDEYEWRIGSSRGKKPCSDTSLERMLFAIERNDGVRTWRDVMNEWNSSHPQDQFDSSRRGSSKFSMMVRSTYRSVMGREELVWARKIGRWKTR